VNELSLTPAPLPNAAGHGHGRYFWHPQGDLGAGWQLNVLVAKGDAELACDEIGLWLGVMVRLVVTGGLVVVDGPGESGDGHDNAGEGDRVNVPVRALLVVVVGQDRPDFSRQSRAEIRGPPSGCPRRGPPPWSAMTGPAIAPR
jgi:hypothetical protein